MRFYRLTNKGNDLGIYAGEDEDGARRALELTFTEINVTVILSSNGMGPHGTEEEFDDYCTFVENTLDERVGFEVRVERAGFGYLGRRPHGNDMEACDAVEAALIDLWGEWCAREGNGGEE